MHAHCDICIVTLCQLDVMRAKLRKAPDYEFHFKASFIALN